MKIAIIIIGLFITVVIIGFFVLGLFNMQPDNKKVACSELPSAEEVQKVLTDHEAVIRELKQLSDKNGIWFSVDTERCPGKADILIYYGTELQRKQIKEKIGEKFFGVPYRMFNV